MSINGICFPMEGFVLGPSFEERLKNGIAAVEIIMDDVDKERRVHKLVDQPLGHRTVFVEFCPLRA